MRRTGKKSGNHPGGKPRGDAGDERRLIVRSSNTVTSTMIFTGRGSWYGFGSWPECCGIASGPEDGKTRKCRDPIPSCCTAGPVPSFPQVAREGVAAGHHHPTGTECCLWSAQRTRIQALNIYRRLIPASRETARQPSGHGGRVHIRSDPRHNGPIVPGS
jgi:hypothetical protein